jgi:hypothetical protein
MNAYGRSGASALPFLSQLHAPATLPAGRGPPPRGEWNPVPVRKLWRRETAPAGNRTLVVQPACGQEIHKQRETDAIEIRDYYW